jgi:hypothetical protein
VIELYNPRNERVNCEVWKIQWFKVSALVPIKDLDREIVVTESAEEIENRLNKRLADLLSDSPT